MAESFSLKAPNFLSKLYAFTFLIHDLYGIFYAKKNRTIEHFKMVLRYFYVILILLQLHNEIQSNSVCPRGPRFDPRLGRWFELLLRQEFRQPFLDLP